MVPGRPTKGLRCNPAKLLLDPHATAIEGEVKWDERVFGHRFDDPEQRNDTDSAPNVPRCMVTASDFDWEGDRAPRTPLDETVIYETHVKGPDSAPPRRARPSCAGPTRGWPIPP